ncbi:MAG: hypothetical protein AB9M60_10510 [Leptothrix sp. (in: b-proteobacteria)]
MKTDAQTQPDVMAELKWNRSIHATPIGVEPLTVDMKVKITGDGRTPVRRGRRGPTPRAVAGRARQPGQGRQRLQRQA